MLGILLACRQPAGSSAVVAVLPAASSARAKALPQDGALFDGQISTQIGRGNVGCSSVVSTPEDLFVRGNRESATHRDRSHAAPSRVHR